MAIRPTGHFELGQRVGRCQRKPQGPKNTNERLFALRQVTTGPAHRSHCAMVKHDFSVVLRNLALHVILARRYALQQALKQHHIQSLRQLRSADVARAGLVQSRMNVHLREKRVCGVLTQAGAD